MTSVIASGSGSNPLSLYHCSMRSSPAEVKSFVAFNPSRVSTRSAVKKCAQPPCPQFQQHQSVFGQRPFEGRGELLDHVERLVIRLEEERKW